MRAAAPKRHPLRWLPAGKSSSTERHLVAKTALDAVLNPCPGPCTPASSNFVRRKREKKKGEKKKKKAERKDIPAPRPPATAYRPLVQTESDTQEYKRRTRKAESTTNKTHEHTSTQAHQNPPFNREGVQSHPSTEGFGVVPVTRAERATKLRFHVQWRVAGRMGWRERERAVDRRPQRRRPRPAWLRSSRSRPAWPLSQRS